MQQSLLAFILAVLVAHPVLPGYQGQKRPQQPEIGLQLYYPAIKTNVPAVTANDIPDKPLKYVSHVQVYTGPCGDNFYAHYIYMKESGCRTHNLSRNGCDGIGQACPASKVIGPCGYDYTCQNAWFTSYAQKYGGWAGAYRFWLAHGWW